MNLELRRRGPVDAVEEAAEFDAAAAALADHSAGGERGERRGHAMAEVIMGAPLNLSGPHRHPKLRFVIAEGGIGWIASLLRFMDHWWNDHHHWMKPQLDESPSTYFHRQFWATFEDDRPGLLTRELLGVDRLMWGSDYPHTEGIFPRSREQIEEDFKGVPQAEARAMVADNAAHLYGVN